MKFCFPAFAFRLTKIISCWTGHGRSSWSIVLFEIVIIAHGLFLGCFKLWKLQQNPHIDEISDCSGMYLLLCIYQIEFSNGDQNHKFRFLTNYLLEEKNSCYISIHSVFKFYVIIFLSLCDMLVFFLRNLLWFCHNYIESNQGFLLVSSKTSAIIKKNYFI